MANRNQEASAGDRTGPGPSSGMDQVIMNLPVPALRAGDRIDEWKPLFVAGVSTLLAQGKSGQALAVGMLPAYLNRRPAERELVRQVVKDCDSVDEAFRILISTLDPPLDKYQCMQEMCRLDWVPGVQVDDFFFQLKKLGVHASADLSFVCSLFVSQLPKEVQPKAKSWLADCQLLTEEKARELLAAVKGWLVERGLPLDRGARNFVGMVAGRSDDVCSRGSTEDREGPGACASPDVCAVQGKRGERRCYICNSPEHIMYRCPSRHCAKCGKKGHSAKMCSSKTKVFLVHENEQLGSSEHAVTLGVILDNSRTSAMLDSGASMSVVDESSVADLGLSHKVEFSSDLDSVTGVGGPVVVLGSLTVRVDAGDGQQVKHTLKVLGGDERVLILGRDFLAKFPSTEFDWQQGRIRLGDVWKVPEVMISGGGHAERVAVAALEQMVVPAASDLSAAINPALPQDVHQKFMKILLEERSVFATNPKKPSLSTVAEHRIETNDAQPVKQKTARVSPTVEAEINKQLEEMLENDICRPSSSPWSSRVILVRKKDSSYRFVVDYRDLNKVTKKDAYPAANWQDILDRMHGSKVFSFLDGASAYWSIPLKEEHKEKTAFSVPKGQYEMNVMAFGLCNSQATYQRAIDEVLGDLPHVDTYIDDACVYTETVEEHMKWLKKTLEAYRKNNMQLRLDKCKFGYAEGEFVGHVVSGKGFKPLQCHVSAIAEYPRPSCKKELQRFLGLVNFYRHFIPDMAQTAEPLYRLTRQGQGWHWTPECEQSFETLRQSLKSRPLLAYPQWDKPFWVEVDASSISVGGVLTQESDDGERKPLAFFSSGLTSAQRNYSASEIECWALLAATRKWKKYLRAAVRIVLVTDHNPLVWLKNQRDPRHKFARWIMELESFNYEIVYRRGSRNTVPDSLSRVYSPVDDAINDEEEQFERHVYRISCSDDTAQRIRTEQRSDPVTSLAVSQLIANGRIDRGRYRNYRGMGLVDGTLVKGDRIVVPTSMQREVAQLDHNRHHLGTEKTMQSLKECFFWVGLEQTVRSVCAECVVCGQNKRSFQPEVHLQPVDIGDLKPRRAVAMDIGTLPWSDSGFRYFLVVADMFTRYAEFIPLRDQTAESVKNAFLTEWVFRHGAPQILVTDQARNMDGEVIRSFCEEFGIEKRRSSPYHPEGNGLAERCVQSAKQLLRCMLTEREMHSTEWPSLMKEVGFIFNSTRNSSTKMSPHEVLYGTNLRAHGQLSVSLPGPYVDPEDHLQETEFTQHVIHEQVKENIKSAREHSGRWYNRGKVTPSARNIAPGDMVMLRKEERGCLDPMFTGPYVVVKLKDTSVFIDVAGHEKCVHLNRVKRCSHNPEEPRTPTLLESHEERDGGHAVGGGHTAVVVTDAVDPAPDNHDHTQEDAVPDNENQNPDPDPLSFLPTRTRSGRSVVKNRKYTS